MIDIEQIEIIKQPSMKTQMALSTVSTKRKFDHMTSVDVEHRHSR